MCSWGHPCAQRALPELVLLGPPQPCVRMRRRNVRFQVADATELVLPAGSVDVLFSNWLLMYLSDAEVVKLASDALAWVRSVALSCCIVHSMGQVLACARARGHFCIAQSSVGTHCKGLLGC